VNLIRKESSESTHSLLTSPKGDTVQKSSVVLSSFRKSQEVSLNSPAKQSNLMPSPGSQRITTPIAKFEKALTVGESRDIRTVDAFLKEGGNPNQLCRDSPAWLKWSPIHAASSSNPDCVEILLQGGANVETKTADDNSPLHVAASYSKWKSIELLVRGGANIRAKNAEGHIPLQYLPKDAPSNVVALLTPVQN
jgi:hypothetical protein